MTFLEDLNLAQNRRIFYLAIMEICHQLYCADGRKFIKHLINYYYFNSLSNKEIIFQIDLKNTKVKDFGFDILLHILQFNQRLLPKIRYNVKISQYLEEQILNDKHDIKDIASKLRNGESIKKYYSKKLFNAFDAKSNRKFEDFLLQNLSIRHLHLRQKNRKDNLLIYCQDGVDIVMIGLFKHSIFSTGTGLLKIISILEDEFPEFIKRKILGTIEGDIFTESQIFNLTQKNVKACFKTKYGALMLDSSIKLVLMAEYLHQEINILCDNIFEKIRSVPYKYRFSDDLKLLCQLKPEEEKFTQINIIDASTKNYLANILSKLVLHY